MNNIYIIEDIWYDHYKVLGVYNNIEAALEHVEDRNFKEEFGQADIWIREYGVRTRKQLRGVAERLMWHNGKRYN
jgi:hypothetical protein